MKKLIFTTVLILAIALVSYGKPGNKNKELLNSLKVAMKEATTSYTFNEGEFKKTSFDFIGKKVNAFYDMENNELIGFSIPLSEKDLPQNTMQNIESIYKKYTVKEMIMFIYKTGYYGFYISLTRPEKPAIVLAVNAKGQTSYYGRTQ